MRVKHGACSLGAMRIGLNARLLASDDRRGFNRYAAGLARALQASGRCEVVLFADAPIHPVHRLGALEHRVEPVRPQWRWQHAWLPAALREARVDLFHAPAHWGVPLRSHCPVVATIHDLADRERPEDFAGTSLRAAVRHRFEEWLVVRRAARILTVSQYSARSIERYLRVTPGRIAVTVEGGEPAEAGAARDTGSAPDRIGAPARLGLVPPYFIAVGGFEARKNPGAVVRALAALGESERPAVAFVGRRTRDADELRVAALAAGVDRWVRVLGEVPDADLTTLLAGAVALLMPSRLEGFGLPVVEAMHAGTPSIVSDAGSLPEIAGDAGLVVPVDDAAALAVAMRRLVAEPATRAAFAARARARASQFTWKGAAEQTLAVYEEVLGRIE